LGLQGASVDLANPANVVAITGLTQPGQIGALSLGALGRSLQAAWPADGGIGFAEWSTRSGAPDLRFLVPPQARFASVYEVSLSSRSQVLSFAGRYFTDDAGTSDFGDGVLWFADGGFSKKFVSTRAALIDTPVGTHAVYDGYCDYSLLGFTCRRSYLVADFDVTDPGLPAVETRVALPGYIGGSSATTTDTTWAAAWIEGTFLFAGASVQLSRLLTARRIEVGGPAYGPTRIANAGGGFTAIVYVANGLGQLNGALICPE
jgi:hypothetical protein